MGLDDPRDQLLKVPLKDLPKDAHRDQEPKKVKVKIKGMHKSYVGVRRLSDRDIPFNAGWSDAQYLFDILVQEIPKKHH
jgi:hypothetical protein